MAGLAVALFAPVFAFSAGAGVCATAPQLDWALPKEAVRSGNMPKVSPYAPETWFHIIGGNASKEGIAADIRAIREAGIGGIQLFHGQFGGPWPGVKEQIPCLSAKWEDLIGFAASECRRQGLSFKMQNCPGWSMSGGPWITPDKAMRKLVCFEPGKKPQFDADDDYHEIGSVTFPFDAGKGDIVRTISIPSPSHLNHHWSYEPDATVTLKRGDEVLMTRPLPRGVWQDEERISFAVAPFKTNAVPVEAVIESPHGNQTIRPLLSCELKLDNWEGKAGRVLREFTISTNAAPVRFAGQRTLVFGHVNAKLRNHPAPPEGTGWECDKMSSEGFEANFNGYLDKLLKGSLKGGLLKGTLVDSWECWSQSWTPKMEEDFQRMNGYALRPWLPALFGYIIGSEAATEKFLLDWRRTCSRLIEDNYFGTMARLAHENGMMVQFETAFGDVLAGDPMRFYKYADEPMCEFWSPFDNDGGFVYSHDFKAVRCCVSAAHVYGKPRVSAESFTSFKLTFDETMQELVENANRHFARGVTHLVFHTYTHNPVVGGLPPGSSFGSGIGTPFLREQTWWPFMPGFTRYLADCGRELERGKPVVDILWYLGDALSHRPCEHDDLFENAYKYDYLNHDALMTRLSVKDGRLTFPDGLSYRVLWIPKDTFLLPATKARLEKLAKAGARIVHGDLKPDWPAQLTGGDVYWYERKDGGDVMYFVAAKEGGFRGTLKLRDLGGEVSLDLVRGESRFLRRKDVGTSAPRLAEVARLADWNRPLGAWKDLPGTDEEKAFSGMRTYVTTVPRQSAGARLYLDLGDVAAWARVSVNGRKVADLWRLPYRCEITGLLTESCNEIRVEVTSTWHNRLCYDASLPPASRKTWTIAGPKKGDALTPSGLIGPVRILSEP